MTESRSAFTASFDRLIVDRAQDLAVGSPGESQRLSFAQLDSRAHEVDAGARARGFLLTALPAG